VLQHYFVVFGAGIMKSCDRSKFSFICGIRRDMPLSNARVADTEWMTIMTIRDRGVLKKPCGLVGAPRLRLEVV
ncbi:MAG: hypothetical protein VX189_13470, partial [Planctomycetota bacterium]|nr:hypothetical protein [Planctomycetota bacterium]